MKRAFLSVCAALAMTATSVAAMAESARSASDAAVAVRAVDGWQDAAVLVGAGEALDVRYVTGTWTINVDGKWFDADGYPGYYPRDVQGACAAAQLADEQNGALIGRIGGGPPFLIGNHHASIADRAGPLEMRMNDADVCLHDNGGSVEVRVIVGASATAQATDARSTAVGGTAVPATAVRETALPDQPTPTRPTATDGPTARSTADGTTPIEQGAIAPPTLLSPPPPARLPSTGGADLTPQVLALVGLLLGLGAGARTWRRHRLGPSGG